MELWNTRRLNAPPTYTYLAKTGEVDIKHLETILQDGIKFYKEQYLLNFETALLDRIIYKMKRKFRNSKDFQTLEKVKRDLMIFLQIDISKRLELLLSILPNNSHCNRMFLPTKNMMDFILVRLQGVGKILCRIIEMCKLTMEYYECRLHLGHFWRLAIVAIGLVSRIYILSSNIIKFTCLFYLRLLPFTHKLKNSGAEWLPADYILPKNLKEWLNVEWSKLDEVIEIPDKDFDISLIDLADDSDDDVEFCNEYIELDEDDVEIIKEFKRINKRIRPINYEHNVTILRGFSSDEIDTGVVLPSTEANEEEENEQEDIQLNSNKQPSSVPSTSPVLEKNAKELQSISVDEMDVGEVISSSEDDNENSNISDDNEKSSKTDIGNKNIYDKDSDKNSFKSEQKQIKVQADVLISSSDEELELSSNDSIQFVDEVAAPYKRPSMLTSDFISLNTVNNRFLIQSNRIFPKGISRRLSRKRKERSVDKRIDNTPIKREMEKKINNKHLSIIELIDTPQKRKITYGNISHKNINEIIELSGSTLNESIQVTPICVARKRKSTNSSESNKRSRYSKDNTAVMTDVSAVCSTIKSTAQSLLDLSETSDRKMSQRENHQGSGSWNESFEIGEHLFSKKIENTSTPTKKKRRLKKNNNGKNSICLKDSTIEIDRASKKQEYNITSDIKRLLKKQNKKIKKNIKRSAAIFGTKNNVTKIKKHIKNNNSISQSFQNDTVHSASRSFSYNQNISSDANMVVSSGQSIMNNSKRKNKLKTKTLKRRKKNTINSSPAKNQSSKSKLKRNMSINNNL